MLLVYLELSVDRFSEFDAHYFPGPETAITRLSEPKNYGARSTPPGRTVLCAELPCSVEDDRWRMSNDDLIRLVTHDLEVAGIGLPTVPEYTEVRRLRQAYPIYLKGYQEPFAVLDRWAENQPRLLSYGRQGLFAHDNTHHALAMAYAAVDCLGEKGFDQTKWREYRRTFEKHVVED